jgi:hypothetical protein
MSVNWAENRAVLDWRGAEPVIQRSDGAVNCPAKWDADLTPRALLVGLGSSDREDHPVLDPLKVIAGDCNYLGPPETSGEADQQERLVPQVLEAVTHRAENDEQVLAEKRHGLALGS